MTAAPEIVSDEDKLIDQIDCLLACSNDPLGFVEAAFPVTPEDWQKKVLTHIGDTLATNARLCAHAVWARPI